MRDAYYLTQNMEQLLHDTTAAMWNKAKKLFALNQSYEQVCNRVVQAYENWFYTEATLTAGTSTWERTEFSFPSMPGMMKILYLTDSDGRDVEPLILQAREGGNVSVANKNISTGYWLGHNSLFINASDFADTLRLYYIRRPAKLTFGTAAAGAATTITLEDEVHTEKRDDYYNDIWMQIVSGTGADERAQISDYAGSTRIATVDFTTTPDGTSVYSTESELPEGHNEIVSMGGAIRALMMDTSQRNKLQELQKWYGKLEMDLLQFLEQRQVHKPRSVYIRNTD